MNFTNMPSISYISLYKHLVLLSFLLVAFSSCSGPRGISDSQLLSEEESLFYNKISTRLLAHYYEWQGTKYKEGGTDKYGVDCSGFTGITYRKIFSLQLPRSTDSQEKMCHTVAEKNLLPGDLLFFDTGWFTKHVGIFLDAGMFIHASTSKGVTISSLTNNYWDDALYLAKRCYIH